MFKNSKINTVIMSGLLLGLFIPILFTFYFFIDEQKQKYQQRSIKIIEESIRLSMKESLLLDSKEWLDIAIRTALKNEYLYSISIHKNSETIAFRTKKEYITHTKQLDIPIIDNGKKLADISLVFNLNNIHKDTKREQHHLIQILLMQAFISSIIIFYIIKFKILNPIKTLMRQANLISNKKLNKAFLWKQKDEIGNLGRSIDKTREALKHLFTKLENKACFDALTNVYNRSGFNSIFPKELRRCNRYHHPISLIMFDIDHFKKINDTHGHLMGDKILINLCELVNENIRECDYLIRWGGEEFIIITPETDLNSAIILAEKIRKVVATTPFENNICVTISLAVSQIQEDEDNNTLLQRVDEHLYQAKNSGRNRICY